MSTLNQQLAPTKNNSRKSFFNFLAGRDVNTQEVNLFIAFVGFIILVVASILIANSSSSNSFFVEYASSLNIFLGLVMIGSGTLATKSILDIGVN